MALGRQALRIGLVYRHFNLGGSIARLHVELARHLSERDHDVHVFSIAETRDRELAPHCTFHDVPVITSKPGEWSSRELTSFAFNSAKLLRRQPFDVVHARMPSTWHADVLYLPGVARGESRRAGVGPGRRLLSNTRHPAQLTRAALERRSVRRRSVVRYHVDSREVAADLRRYYSVDPRQIAVVPPGVNLSEFRPSTDRRAERRALGLPERATLLLFCGHDFPRKGLDRAIAALAGMNRRAELVVVGGGAPERYRRLAAELGVEARVHFIGARFDTARFYRAADIFVLPTRVEMWGATVVEAMASGIPAIVTDVAGSAEVVEHGRTGFVLTSPYDKLQLVGLLDRLSEDEATRERVGRAAAEAARRLSWEHHVDIVEADLVSVARELVDVRDGVAVPG